MGRRHLLVFYHLRRIGGLARIDTDSEPRIDQVKTRVVCSTLRRRSSRARLITNYTPRCMLCRDLTMYRPEETLGRSSNPVRSRTSLHWHPESAVTLTGDLVAVPPHRLPQHIIDGGAAYPKLRRCPIVDHTHNMMDEGPATCRMTVQIAACGMLYR